MAFIGADYNRYESMKKHDLAIVLVVGNGDGGGD